MYAGRCWGNPRIRPADEICIVGRKVAEEVVKRSFQKRGTIREHQEIGLIGIPCPRTQIAPTLCCASWKPRLSEPSEPQII